MITLFYPIQYTIIKILTYLILVGGGTGGSTLTSLLAKHSNGSVLLVEAGGQFGPLNPWPTLLKKHMFKKCVLFV